MNWNFKERKKERSKILLGRWEVESTVCKERWRYDGRGRRQGIYPYLGDMNGDG